MPRTFLSSLLPKIYDAFNSDYMSGIPQDRHCKLLASCAKHTQCVVFVALWRWEVLSVLPVELEGIHCNTVCIKAITVTSRDSHCVSNHRDSTVPSTVYSGMHQRKHQCSMLLVIGGFPSQGASNADSVSIWWRHHDKMLQPMWRWVTGDFYIMQVLSRCLYLKGQNPSYLYPDCSWKIEF